MHPAAESPPPVARRILPVPHDRRLSSALRSSLRNAAQTACAQFRPLTLCLTQALRPRLREAGQ